MERLNSVDVETAYYVEKFSGKEGQVFEITTTSYGFIQYHVNFGKDIGVFYAEEVTLFE